MKSYKNSSTLSIEYWHGRHERLKALHLSCIVQLNKLAHTGHNLLLPIKPLRVYVQAGVAEPRPGRSAAGRACAIKDERPFTTPNSQKAKLRDQW